MNSSVRKHLSIKGAFAAALILVSFVFGQASAQDRTFAGYWATSNMTSVVKTEHCDDSLCARIVWLWDVAVEGRDMRDVENAAEARQNQPLVGLPLFSRFNKDGDTWRGRIYNPEDGRNYRATVSLRSKDILRLKGCWGPFCLTRYWRRLNSISLPTRVSLNFKGNERYIMITHRPCKYAGNSRIHSHTFLYAP